MKEYYSFIYLDESNIDQLYSQIFEDIKEQNIVKSTEETLDATIKANLFGVLGSNLDGQLNDLTSVSTIVRPSISQRAQKLINYFRSDIISIQEIISRCPAIEDSTFFVGKAPFFLSDICDENTGSSELENEPRFVKLTQSSLIMLESGNTEFVKKYSSTYADSDDYYAMNMSKQSTYGIMMYLSNSKVKKSIRHLTHQIKRGKHFNFSVFGKLSRYGPTLYGINPYALWQ